MAESTASSDLPERGLAAIGEVIATLDPIRFRAWADLGLTITQLRALAVVSEHPGITVGELAERFEVRPPSITGLVDRLVAQGYIRREDDSADRRLVRHALTDCGFACLNKTAGESDRHFLRLFARMKEADLAAFVRGLEGFVDAYRAMPITPPSEAVISPK